MFSLSEIIMNQNDKNQEPSRGDLSDEEKKGTGLRELRGLIITAVGPTPTEYKPIPHTNSEIQKLLEPAITTLDAATWHKAQLREIARQATLKISDFRYICEKVGISLVEGCRRAENLRYWTKTGLLPAGFYSERHLLNTALGNLKSAIETMEMISKSPELSEEDSPTRLMAAEYFKRVYLLVIIFAKIAHSNDFACYLEEFDLRLDAPAKLIKFDNLSPLGDYDNEFDIRHISSATVLDPINKVGVRNISHRLDVESNIPKVFPSTRAYGDLTVVNALLLETDDQEVNKGGTVANVGDR